MSAAITNADVNAYLGLDTGRDVDAITDVVAAVNDLLSSWKSEPTTGWPARYKTGATMLAARIYRRRNSPSGVESFGDIGAMYVQRNDPDIAQLLDMGRYAKPQVG